MKHKVYDELFKVHAVKYMQETGLNVYEASANLGIPHHTTLKSWQNIYIKKGERGLLGSNPNPLNEIVSENYEKLTDQEQKV